MDVLLSVSVQMDMETLMDNVFLFLLRVEAVDMDLELAQDVTKAEDASLDKDVALVLDVDVDMEDACHSVIVKPVPCSKTLAMLLIPDVRHTMDRRTCWMKALDNTPETMVATKTDLKTTVRSKDKLSTKETRTKTCTVEKNAKVKPAMTCANPLMNAEMRWKDAATTECSRPSLMFRGTQNV